MPCIARSGVSQRSLQVQPAGVAQVQCSIYSLTVCSRAKVMLRWWKGGGGGRRALGRRGVHCRPMARTQESGLSETNAMHVHDMGQAMQTAVSCAIPSVTPAGIALWCFWLGCLPCIP